MTCPPFCSKCGGNLGRAYDGDSECNRCKLGIVGTFVGRTVYRDGEPLSELRNKEGWAP